MREVKPLFIAMAMAFLTFFVVDKLGWLGDTYGMRSGALHIIFLFFGWFGYMFSQADAEVKKDH